MEAVRLAAGANLGEVGIANNQGFLVGTVFDDNAASGITTGSSPGYTGIFRPVVHALSAGITGGGSGYKINDALTVVGGSFTTPAQLKVTAVGALTGALAPAANGCPHNWSRSGRRARRWYTRSGPCAWVKPASSYSRQSSSIA